MGTQRTSQKDVLNAINSLTDVITQLVANGANTPVSAPAAAIVTSAPAPVNDGEQTIDVDPAYVTRMEAKVADKCKDGSDRILYARHNLRGETKLAYCLASNWTGLKDRGLIGAIKHISA